MELVIEEISRGNKLLGRHRFDNCQQIKIGRGYNNQIILSDPHICPEHLQLTFSSGQWLISDCDTVNGSKLDHKRDLPKNHVIESGDIVSIGKSQLRFILPDHPVAPSVKISVFEALTDFTRQPIVLLANLCLFLFLAALTFYLNSNGEVVISKVAMSAVGMTLAFTIVPSLYTLFSYLTKHEARFLTHIGISFVIFNLFWLLDFISDILRFNLSSQWHDFGLSLLLSSLLLFALFWLNFYIGFHQTARRRMVFALSFTAVILATNHLVKVSNTPDFRAAPRYDATLMIPLFSISTAESIDGYIEQSDSLYQSASQAAMESDKD